MIRTAISPRLATRTVLNMRVIVSLGSASHSEHAIAHRAASELRRRRPTPDPSTRRVSIGIDHAVVPQAGGGVVGVPLSFVLLAHRSLERLHLVLGSRSPSRSATVASTEAACSPPITEMRAFGHIQRKRGE